MTRAPKLFLIFAVMACATSLDLSAWKYRKRITLTQGDGLAVVELDREVYVGSEFDREDIRVVRDGAEVPYIRDALTVGDVDGAQPEKLLDMSVTEGPSLQFTVNPGRYLHDRIRIRTSEQNFRQRVRIEASDDNRHWAVLRSDGAIFDFTQDYRQFSSLDVEFPVSTKPFLRVTILGWSKIPSVLAAYVNHKPKRPAEREVLATISPNFIEDTKTQSTVATLDLGVEGLPIDRITFDVESKQFQRAVGVELSTNGKDWAYLAQGVIARLPGTDFTEEDLSVSIPETYHRCLRIRIYNRDDQPLQIGRIQLEGLIRYLKFVASDAGNYWLYYGNSKVHAPVYDLPDLLSRREHVKETRWGLGSAEVNPAYHAPALPRKPWSEQHPAILYTVLGGAVLALGIATLRFMARLRTPA
jgi:hypothetical protein